MRCAGCGSKNVVIDKKKEGYSISKGIVGTALLGSGGAVMGLRGKEQTYYHCSACGQVLSYSMSLGDEQLIDSALKNPRLNRDILEMQKKRYPNIEYFEEQTYNNNSEKVNDSKSSSNIIEDSHSSNMGGLAQRILEYHDKTKKVYCSTEELNEVFGYDGTFIISPIQLAMASLQTKGYVTFNIVDGVICGYTFYDNEEDIENNVHNQEVLKKNRKIMLEIMKEKRSELKNILFGIMETDNKKNYDNIVMLLSNELISKHYSDDEQIIDLLAKETISSAIITDDVYKDKNDKAILVLAKTKEERKQEERKKEKEEYNKNVRLDNKKIQTKIQALEHEKHMQERIIIANKFTLRGISASKKAKEKIKDLNKQIAELKKDIRSEI
ncbi:MAG: hypothetical protein HFH31_01790 [Bacilli bacterium]|nr:hypothetical protein [Bacilli bacterium]